ncbi:MAG: VWA domain-containing protein [Rikenellaceae bacterium]
MVRFENIYMLYLLLVLIPIVAYYIFKVRDGHSTLQISSIEGFRNTPKSTKYYLRHLPFALRMVALTLIIFAIARPQKAKENQTTTTEGIDIAIALDISTSMLARDFNPDRISAAKDIATKFIIDRHDDRIALIVFAGESYTQCPLTTDHATLINLTSQVRPAGETIDDGTAIGNGLATAVSRLKDSPSKSKVIILLTDGINNSGQITPSTAAEIAKTFGIKVYTIGVGSMGTAPYPAIDMFGNMTYVNSPVEIDEKGLTDIATMTGGRYFRATSNERLKSIYEEINALEKSKIDVNHFVLYQEKYSLFVIIAMVILIIEILIKNIYLRQIP